MELNLKNKSVLVVGASKGIGKAIALGFAAEGSKLVIIARSKDIIEEVKKECLKAGAASCEAVVSDITKEPRKVAETCLKKFGPFDVVVHCVGTSLVPRDIFGSEEDYLTALNENALASIQMNAVLIPDMISKGIKRARGTRFFDFGDQFTGQRLICLQQGFLERLRDFSGPPGCPAKGFA
jgi:3-oxoacyl-[acyl-carrier protein] reductase